MMAVAVPSRAACRAAMKPSASWKRRAGSFSSARMTTSSSSGVTAGLCRLGGAGRSLTCLSAIDTALSPSKGTRPVSSS